MSRAGSHTRVAVSVLAACLVAGTLVAGTLVAGVPSWGQVSGSSTITTVAGTRVAGFSGDGGPARQARLNQPRDTAVGPDGSIYVTDTFNNRIRRISPSGTITTVAGNGSATYNGDGIAATRASLSWPHDVTVADDGVIYIADSNHYRIRRVGLDGVITTIAGTGAGSSTGDGGPATAARIGKPKTVALFDDGLFLASTDNTVRRVDLSSGVITRVAGTGTAGFAGDGGPATRARLNGPQRLQIDAQGNIYVADTLNSAIRRIDAASGTITTVAGIGGTAGSSGDGGPAVAARLNQPRGLALEGDRILYIADSDNHRVRALDLTTGILTRVAGSTAGYSGDGGPAASARLRQPRGLTVTPRGDLIVAEVGNNVLRSIAGTPLP